MQVEPDRKGWARLADMYHKYDEDKIRDAKEDIDTLLVFVRATIFRSHSFSDITILRLVCSQRLQRHSLLSRTKPYSLKQRILQTRSYSKSLPSSLVSL